MATLDFKGKALVQNYHLTVKYHELVSKKDKSLTDKVRLDDNLIIHGDNLKALKALLPTYAGKVKCIYIDPPYNTGNEGWAYNDNVNSPMMQEWLGKTVDRDDLTRNDKWLCMMMPRLRLLRELLRNDGGIFISIDYNEEANLRLLLNEVFGEENYRNTFVVARVKKNIHEKEKVKAVNFGYNAVLSYGKSDDCLIDPPTRKHEKAERWHAFDAPGIRSTMEYEIFGQRPPKGRHWMFSEDKAKEMIEAGELRKSSNSGAIQYLIAASDFTLLDTNWTDIQEYDSEWNFPNGEKNIELVKRIVKMLDEPGVIILDSFSGSGTTAHAVLALNKEDGGNRKFILVECEDYADEITAERARRVIKGVRGASDENLRKGLGGTFSYFELGKAIELESILDGKNLPSYHELARYVFYTATGEEFDERKVNEKRQFVGESKNHEVFLFYKPDIDYLKKTALTLERAEELGKPKANGKRRLVFAPTKYLDQEQLDALRIDFAQLPFEIYKLAR